MLNNLKLKTKSYISYNHPNKVSEIAQAKNYLPSDKEWFNSVYAYNKNTIKLLPTADKVILKSIRSYFNLYSSKLENNARIPYLRRRFKRLSTNRLIVSKAELKHSSDKVMITVYVYNRQRYYYISRLIDVTLAIANVLEEDFFIEKPGFSNLLLKGLKKKGVEILSKVYKQKKDLLKTLNKKNKSQIYEKKYLKDFFFKCLQNEMILMYLRQIILFNKSKFETTYLLPLTKLLNNVYHKNVEFNLVDLQYLYLNSSIFSETLVTKIRNKKNRLLRVLKASLGMFQLAPIDKFSALSDMHNRKKAVQNLRVNYLESERVKKNINKNLKVVLKNISLPSSYYNIQDEMYTTYNVLDSIKHKSITGIRIEAAGRLTRRNTAAKSVFKLKYKGNLKNMDSSYKGLSSALLRGHDKSNVQYTKSNSKLRIGSFGIKNWVSAN